MININGKELSARYYGRKVITAVYKGSILVWQAAHSCFGAGFWVNEKPWINEEGYRNII